MLRGRWPLAAFGFVRIGYSIIIWYLVTTSADPQGWHYCGNQWVWVENTKMLCHITWPVAVLREDGVALSKELVNEILASLDLPVCKHLRFNDASVSRLYSPDCARLRWRDGYPGPAPDCHCLSCTPGNRIASQKREILRCTRPRWRTFIFGPSPSSPRCHCSSCIQRYQYPDLAGMDMIHGCFGECRYHGSRIYSAITEWIDGRGDVLELHVMRRIKPFRGCTDDAWIQQLSDQADWKEFERRWYAATRERIDRVIDRYRRMLKARESLAQGKNKCSRSVKDFPALSTGIFRTGFLC